MSLQLLGQRKSGAKLHKEKNPLVSLPVLPDDQAVGHFPEFVHHVVDFGSPDAHAGRFEHRIGSSVEGNTARILVEHDVIPVTPDPGIDVEVGAPVLFPARIVPEVEGHGGSRRLADQLALPIEDGISLFIIGLHLHGQGRALKLAGVYRADDVPGGKAAVDVRAAGDGIEMEILLDFLVDVLKSFRGERRAGLGDLPQRGEVDISRGCNPWLLR